MEMKTVGKFNNVNTWTAEQVGEFFEREGFPYKDEFVNMDLTGERLEMLTAEDIKTHFTISKMGHRMGIQKLLAELKREARKARRNTEIDRQEQAYDGSIMTRWFETCCGCCPWDPDKYILTASSLTLEEFEISRICGVWKCTCMGGKKSSDNILLDQVRDVDTIELRQGILCCAVNKMKIIIAVGAGGEASSAESRVLNKEILVEGEHGEDFANKILMAVEERSL
jgi:hypothetical protein